MVMEASGRSERKYCHCRGGGQRLMRTSRRLMERSTDRLTTTGTNSELPCCRMGRWEAGNTGVLTQPGRRVYMDHDPRIFETTREDPRDFPCWVPSQNCARSCSSC